MANNKPQTIVSPAGTAVYPWITKADTKFNPGGDYRTGLRMPIEVAQPLIDKLEAIRQEALAESKKTKKKPPKEGNLPWSPVYDDEGNETGEIEFKFKTKASITTKEGKTINKVIKCVDAKKQPLDESISIYGGSVLKVAFQPIAYDVAAVGVGLSLRMVAVQVLELVEGGGGGNFFDEEDGYSAKAKVEESSEDEDF